MRKMEVKETGIETANQPSHEMGGFMYCRRASLRARREGRGRTHFESDEVLGRGDGGGHAADVGGESYAEDEGFRKGGFRGEGSEDRLHPVSLAPFTAHDEIGRAHV